MDLILAANTTFKLVSVQFLLSRTFFYVFKLIMLTVFDRVINHAYLYNGLKIVAYFMNLRTRVLKATRAA